MRSDAPCEEDQTTETDDTGLPGGRPKTAGRAVPVNTRRTGGEVRHCRATTVIVMATRRRCVVPRVTVRPEDRVISLRDGRSMGFADYGPADGFVVVNAHGGTVLPTRHPSRRPGRRGGGIRLISPDRPGSGCPIRARTDSARLGVRRRTTKPISSASRGWACSGGPWEAVCGRARIRVVVPHQSDCDRGGRTALTEARGRSRGCPASIGCSRGCRWVVRGSRRRPSAVCGARPSDAAAVRADLVAHARPRRRGVGRQRTEGVRGHDRRGAQESGGRRRGIPGVDAAVGLRAGGSSRCRSKYGGATRTS